MAFKLTSTVRFLATLAAAVAVPIAARAQTAIPVMDDKTREMVAVAITIYILPSIVAVYRKHPSKYSIILLDLILGITGIGWLVALIWAFGSTKQHVVIVSGHPAINAGNSLQTSPVANSVATKTVGERIADLKAMLDSGAISQAEFDLLKADALKAVA